MLRQLKRKLVASLTDIEVKEDFLYNKWLRIIPSEDVTVGVIQSQLLDTSKIEYSIPETFLTEHFFELTTSNLYPEDNKHIFGKIFTNPVYFQLFETPAKVLYHTDIEPRPAGYSAKQIKFVFKSISQKDIQVKFYLPVPAEYSFLLREPVITDHLENLKTKVSKIELLKPEELNPKTAKLEINKYEVKSLGKLKISKLKVERLDKITSLTQVKVPEIGDYKSSVETIQINLFKRSAISRSPKLQFVSPSISVGSYNFDQTASVEYYGVVDKGMIDDEKISTTLLKRPDEVKDVISLLLKNTYKIEWEKRKDDNIILTKTEEESAHFLAQNEYAFLAEELGIDKIKESLAALKFLLFSRIIRSALIILPSDSLKHEKYSAEIGIDSGWMNKLKILCPELSVSIIRGDDEERNKNWNKSASIFLVDQKTIIKDFRSKILTKNRLAAFDCLLFDEIQSWLNGQIESKEFLQQLKSKMVWALSSIIIKNILSEFNNLLNESCRISSYKTKKFSKLENEYPDITFCDCWVSLYEDQENEYVETVKQCRKDLKRILESENPFRFQANIYMLLHKLYQIENFAHGFETSPKTYLLLQHLQAIQGNGHKVIILSQYDKQGTRKIEKFLEKNKINYINAPSSLSGEEIKKAIYLFKNKENITAFLTNVKENRLNFGDMFVPYIIKYDSWWNPAANLQTQNLFQQNTSNQKLFVFSYKVYNALDELVQKLIFDKNLLKHNITSTMSLNALNDLISVDEWLEIFGMPVESKSVDRQMLIDSTIEKLNKSSLADFRATLSRFFFSLGYSKIDILEHENSASFDIAGESKAGNRLIYLFGKVFIENTVSIKTIKQIILDTSLSKNGNVFIITNGKFEKGSEKFEKNNVMLLDVNKLSQYLVNMNLVQADELQTTVKLDVGTHENSSEETD